MGQPQKRRWFRYRLLGFLIVSALVAAGAGWRIRRERSFAEAVSTLRSANCSVHFLGVNAAPWWHRVIAGDAVQECVLSVPLANFSEPQLEKILIRARAMNLHHLDAHGAAITEPVARRIGRLTTLRILNLRGSSIDDSGLMHLEKLNRLEWLNISQTQATSQGAGNIRRALPGCEIVE